MGINYTSSSGPRVLFLRRAFVARYLLDYLAYSIWNNGVVTEGEDREDTQSTRVGKTNVGSYSSELANDSRNVRAWISFYLGVICKVK